MKAIASLILILVMGTVQGQTTGKQWHFKKDNSNELYVFYTPDSGCTGLHENVIDSEMVQARLKRKKDLVDGELFLHVGLSCLPLKDNISLVYTTVVQFGRTKTVYISESMKWHTYGERYIPGYGTYGITSLDRRGEERLSNVLRNMVERALTDYLKANFDL